MAEASVRKPPVLMKHAMIKTLEKLSRRRDAVHSMRRRLESLQGAEELGRRLVANEVCDEQTARALIDSWGSQQDVMNEVWTKFAEAARRIEESDLPLDMWWGQVDGQPFEIDVTQNARCVRVVMWTNHFSGPALAAKLRYDRGYLEEIKQMIEGLETIVASVEAE
jgi:hypothetical protein